MKANLKRYTRQNKNNKKIYTPHNSQYMEATQVAVHQQGMDKEDVVYID